MIFNLVSSVGIVIFFSLSLMRVSETTAMAAQLSPSLSACTLAWMRVCVWSILRWSLYLNYTREKLYCISESLKSYVSLKPTFKWFCDTRKVARCSLLLTNFHKIQVTVTRRRWSGFRYCRHKKSSARLNFDLQYSIISHLLLLWNSLLDHQRRLNIPAGDITQVTWLRLANYRLPNWIKFRPFCFEIERLSTSHISVTSIRSK